MGTVAQIRRTSPDVVCVALIAHDAKKEDLLQLVRRHRAALGRVRLVAPIDSAIVLEGIGLKIEAVPPGGTGLTAVRAATLEGRIDAVILLRDPTRAHATEPFERSVLRACDRQAVPAATNPGTAEIVLSHLAERSAATTSR